MYGAAGKGAEIGHTCSHAQLKHQGIAAFAAGREGIVALAVRGAIRQMLIALIDIPRGTGCTDTAGCESKRTARYGQTHDDRGKTPDKGRRVRAAPDPADSCERLCRNPALAAPLRASAIRTTSSQVP